MKHILGQERRQEGSRNRLFTVIQCDKCESKTYERKSKNIQHALSRGCGRCVAPKAAPSFIQDGRTSHPLWRRYHMMRERCYSPKHKSFHRYGGRGIQVCTRWLIDFWAYVEDIEALGVCPDGWTIDRIDNDGPYDPRNVQWASPKDQVANQGSKYELLTKHEAQLMRGAIQHLKHWWAWLGLKANPYIYGPMPWKKTSERYRRSEAVQRGWYASRPTCA